MTGVFRDAFVSTPLRRLLISGEERRRNRSLSSAFRIDLSGLLALSHRRGARFFFARRSSAGIRLTFQLKVSRDLATRARDLKRYLVFDRYVSNSLFSLSLSLSVFQSFSLFILIDALYRAQRYAS